MDWEELVEGAWALLSPHLPPRQPSTAGRPRVPDRAVLPAVLYVQSTGCTWSQVDILFDVSRSTAHRRFREWNAMGLWSPVAELTTRYCNPACLAAVECSPSAAS